ncbi:DUF1569 domain-containing protein [Segetibacter koreensis]|uniref:DUF1569 domain-containing protein n=1 Tax=Segetibacter koreensis TaxID=398037 RepID=UPI0003638753|nr:DUF1569 domain-containing protein [Segetibacter koreensis]
MKTIFDKLTREELINRINSLNENSTAQWGKMNVSQMLKHCTQWDEMALGKKKYKQSFLGKLFGKMALKSMMKDEPMKKNLPTVPSFRIKENIDVAEGKRKWIKLLDEYEHFSNDGFIHPFFGAMTKENTGYIVYKHSDHHLRQFGA